MTKTRFAPSPTGFLHIGSLRTALFAYLFAKNKNGKFLLRIEDTDQERFVEGGIENILHSLSWAGITPDEGMLLGKKEDVIQNGENGPYIQSQRLEVYKKYIDQLIEKNKAYHCFCTKERLGELRKYQEANKMAPGYDGCCRKLSLKESKKKVESGEKYIVRMKMPKDGTTKIVDLVRGDVEFKNELIDDQVLLKADGFPTYHLAVVVDDHLMGVTHVIRGEEWLPSTPKHIQLYSAFGFDMPKYAHLSLLVNEKKQKLSKRQGDVSVRDYIEKGYLPDALINFVAFLGWNPGDEQEIFSLKELVENFSFEKVSKAAAVFNVEKLDWYNEQYIKQMDSSQLTKECLPYLVNAGLISEEPETGSKEFEWLKKIISIEKKRMSKLSDLPEAVGFLFADKLKYDSEILVWKKSDRDTVKNNLEKLKDYLEELDESDWQDSVLQEKIGEWIKKQNLTNGEVLWPMRTALSGQKNSPSPFEIAGVLGKEKTLDRVKEAIDSL